MTKQPKEKSTAAERDALNAQRTHWDRTFTRKSDMFGAMPSEPAQRAAELFESNGLRRILELGGGQGRDALWFAQRGFDIHVLDYSQEGVEAILSKAAHMVLSKRLSAATHDVRHPLPLPDESFDACYSHMLYCMALTTAELQALAREVWRVLRPGGLNVYTVRHTGDAHYGTGIHRGEDMWEVDGFIVHFFDRQKVERLAEGYELVAIDEFEEGGLPRKLFRVTLRKPGGRT